MHKMGFGPRMFCRIFLLGQDTVSQVMLNGGVTFDIALTRFVREGCHLAHFYLLLLLIHC